jgi:hypothetical protein
MKQKYKERALEWYKNHTDHVMEMLKTTDCYYQPTEAEDLIDPSIWMAEHWKWFVMEYELVYIVIID